MKKAFFLLLLIPLCYASMAQRTISGTITDAKTGETLIGATVFDTVSKKGTISNQHGRYTITLKEADPVLRFSFVGYETQYIPITDEVGHHIDIELSSSVTLREVTITGERIQHVESSQTSVVDLPVEQVKAVPVLFGETDVVKVVQLLPGVQSGSEGMSGMYVRGGGPDENLFLLDGVPM